MQDRLIYTLKSMTVLHNYSENIIAAQHPDLVDKMKFK